MKVANNYSDIRNRDKKLYTISGTKISSTGISYAFIKIFSALFVTLNAVGIMICMVMGEIYYIPINSDAEVQLGFDMFFLGSPFILTFILMYTKVQKYTLFEFLVAYFKPKRVRDQNGKIVKYVKYKQDTIFERVF